ncbi:hypothetical protein HK099_000687 [Clydaea vesicula]|uniref:RRM domain-containing protein n=1 Tax=Clydaea vesicula TaxID=447962 RepID=A0AAD5XZY8_9FUNG|nr:hypothetical protein HK099_000687 [Clydaea vesicula]
MNKIRTLESINKKELSTNTSHDASWHNDYADSAYIYIGSLPYNLTEGDIIAVFSQYGEIVDVTLLRDKVTGKSKGGCFLAYENQKSTVLAVDNLSGIKLLGRTIRVVALDHARPKGERVEEGKEEEYKQRELQKQKIILPKRLRGDVSEESNEEEDVSYSEKTPDKKLLKILDDLKNCDPEDPLRIQLIKRLEKIKKKIAEKQ